MPQALSSGSAKTTNQYWPVWGAGDQTGRGAVVINASGIYYATTASAANQMFLTAHPGYHVTTTLGPYPTRAAAQAAMANRTGTGTYVNPNPKSNYSLPDLTGWLTGIGGDIASGLESGFINIILDIWRVIYPALEILAGVALLILVLGFIFKDDLLGVLPGIAAAAAV
jgi:hypothetical protein